VPRRRAIPACSLLAICLALTPASDALAQRASPVSTRIGAQRVRVERVTTAHRVRVFPARHRRAPGPSLADRPFAPGHDAPPDTTTPGPALLAGGEAIDIERAVFAGDFVLVRTAGAIIRRVDFEDIDALLLDDHIDAPARGVALTFADGRRIVGALSTDEGAAVTHPLFGHTDLAGAERLTLRRIDGAPSLDAPGVLLANGDVLLGPARTLDIGVAIELDDRTLLLPWGRIAEVVFDQPRAQAGDALRAHLADGSIINASRLVSRPDLDAVDVTLAAGATVRLAERSLAGVSRRGAEIAALRPAPTLEIGDDALLAHPGTHRLEIPDGAELVRGVVRMPGSARRWGTAYVTLWTGGEPVFFARLHADRPGAPFSAPVAGPVTMTVHAGRGGGANAVTGLAGQTITLAADDAP